MARRMQRWIALGGLTFVVVVLVSILVVPQTPDTHASAAKVVRYYHDHKVSVGVETYLILIAVFVGTFYFWYLREFIASAADRRLTTIGFAGALIFAVSGGAAAGIDGTLIDGVNHLDPSSMQTLNALGGDFADIAGAAGIAVFLVATNIAIVRSGVLPVWLGWVGIVLGVASIVATLHLGLPAIGLWIIISSVVILVRGREPGAAPVEAAATT